MKGTLECDHAVSSRVEPGELDRVLDRLGARVEERTPGRSRDRDERSEPLGQLDVTLVRNHGEIGVKKSRGLFRDRLDDARVVVPDVRDSHATDEVDERVAVHIRDGRAEGFSGDDRPVHDEGACNGVPFPLEDLASARARNLCSKLDYAGRSHARQPIRGGRQCPRPFLAVATLGGPRTRGRDVHGHGQTNQDPLRPFHPSDR